MTRHDAGIAALWLLFAVVAVAGLILGAVALWEGWI
jgi:hypothetical protein